MLWRDRRGEGMINFIVTVTVEGGGRVFEFEKEEEAMVFCEKALQKIIDGKINSVSLSRGWFDNIWRASKWTLQEHPLGKWMVPQSEMDSKIESLLS
jgi:hypothetical protein